jgi:pimeloyl-ACP methyl ester carboxylesterase
MLHFSKYEHPTSKEWVTFIHGAGGSSAIWYQQVKSFKKEFNVLLVDLRGHGKSKKPLNEKFKRYSFDTIGDDII